MISLVLELVNYFKTIRREVRVVSKSKYYVLRYLKKKKKITEGCTQNKLPYGLIGGETLLMTPGLKIFSKILHRV